MTKGEVIERMAKERRVEAIVCSVAHVRRLTPDLQDLVQMVYLALLGYRDAIILDLWDSGQMDYFAARIVINQFRSKDSPFRDTYTNPRRRAVDLSTIDNLPDPDTK